MTAIVTGVKTDWGSRGQGGGGSRSSLLVVMCVLVLPSMEDIRSLLSHTFSP
jgi:hypothetical protein